MDPIRSTQEDSKKELRNGILGGLTCWVKALEKKHKNIYTPEN